MLTQALDITHFESRRFGGRNYIVSRRELSIRKHVGVDERVGFPELPEDPLTR